MKSLRTDLLEKILSQPSAPFRERHVISVITEELRAHRVPFFQDPIGNIVIGVKTKKEYLALVRKKSAEPVRVFIAHLDHPGFHGMEWKSDTELEVRWHGGSPTQHIEAAKVWLADATGPRGEARVLSAQMLTSGRAIETATIKVAPQLRASVPDAKKLYGGFAFRAPVWRDGDLYYTKAADDLVGSFAILSLALDTFGKGKKPKVPFLGLLTRAEEVGFIGAIGHFELGWLKKSNVLCVSLETSRALPGAEIGKGPVVRLGDRSTVFDSASLKIFTQLAQESLPERHQKRIMDGGTCEATAATAYGLPSVGISVPLGNYHNQGFEGGPDSAGALGPSPEFVNAQDVQGLIELCHALLSPKQPWKAPWQKTQDQYRKELRKYFPLLRSGP